MKIIKSVPRGYCHGVINALNIVSKTIKENDENLPIYVLGAIVHNNFVKNAFNEAGAITVEGTDREKMLDNITHGIVIITAHGTSDDVIRKAKDRGLIVVDATCTDVKKTHNIIKNKIKEEYTVLFIGKKNHPETDGILGIDKSIILIQTKNDIDNLTLTSNKIFITNQTTMSKFDTSDIISYAKQKFPTLKVENEICLATSTRQEVALKNAQISDLTFVVGDPNSNNTNKLTYICQHKGNCPSYRIENVEQIDINLLLDNNVNVVHVTSGASTPSQITKEVCEFIELFDKTDESTWNNHSNIDLNKIVPRSK